MAIPAETIDLACVLPGHSALPMSSVVSYGWARILRIGNMKFTRPLLNPTNRSTSRIHPGGSCAQEGSRAQGSNLAIIDWDCVGWRLEYWEVTKSKFASLSTPTEWFDALDRACGSSYELQLVAELRLWKAAEFPSSPGTVLDPPEGVDAVLESACQISVVQIIAEM
ncbi:hypothetical protein DFH09DRAFT_1095834 [Mycena vulgaris]|nr:hypothetical protein DFH09DRAFT_1095834 [Mycena vulgaris]